MNFKKGDYVRLSDKPFTYVASARFWPCLFGKQMKEGEVFRVRSSDRDLVYYLTGIREVDFIADYRLTLAERPPASPLSLILVLLHMSGAVAYPLYRWGNTLMIMHDPIVYNAVARLVAAGCYTGVASLVLAYGVALCRSFAAWGRYNRKKKDEIAARNTKIQNEWQETELKRKREEETARVNREAQEQKRKLDETSALVELARQMYPPPPSADLQIKPGDWVKFIRPTTSGARISNASKPGDFREVVAGDCVQVASVTPTTMTYLSGNSSWVVHLTEIAKV